LQIRLIVGVSAVSVLALPLRRVVAFFAMFGLLGSSLHGCRFGFDPRLLAPGAQRCQGPISPAIPVS
jgi:hypothetical protein